MNDNVKKVIVTIRINFLRYFEIKYKVKKNKISKPKDVLSPET